MLILAVLHILLMVWEMIIPSFQDFSLFWGQRGDNPSLIQECCNQQVEAISRKIEGQVWMDVDVITKSLDATTELADVEAFDGYLCEDISSQDIHN